jgi:hypothetical protein
MAATTNPSKVKTDINSSLPAHIWNIYIIFKPTGISTLVIPQESPTLAAAEVDSNKEARKG